jgi:2-polyprenyl-6-hydroxyphenyl methylase/3-demethylubiquinone-9 3-methyltransferase
MMSVKAYYDRYWTADGFNPTRSEPFPELRGVLEEHARPGEPWLDVGCGDGGTAGVWLDERGCAYVGADVSASAVEQARSRGLEARVIADAAELPFEDDTFAGVLAVELLEHLFEPQRAAEEFLRVLRPGGLLFVSLPNVAYWRRRLELLLIGRFDPLGDDLSIEEPWRDPHIRFFTSKTLERMLTRAGFRAEVHGYAGAFLADVPRVGRVLNGRSSRLYSLAQKRLPNLLGRRIFAVAVKPI